jgi:hypothetical protein
VKIDDSIFRSVSQSDWIGGTSAYSSLEEGVSHRIILPYFTNHTHKQPEAIGL